MFEWLWLFIYGIVSTAASYDDLAITIPEELKIDSIALELQLHDNNTSTALSENIKFNTNSNNNLRRSFSGDHPEKFTDFIQAVIALLINYDDDDIEQFFTTFNEEVSKYHYNGCKFYELTDNDAFRNFVARKFHEVKDIPAATIRKKLLKISNQIDDAKDGMYEKELLDYINSLYKQDSIKKFNKFLHHLKEYSLKTNENLDLVKIVRDGMRSLIFNHYTNLDYNTRAAIKFKLLSYWQYYIASEPSLRSQLNPMERQLLGNLNGDAGIFYFTKENKHEKNNVKYSKFLPHYPKLVLDSKIMFSPPHKTTPSSTSELITYNQYLDDKHTEINIGTNQEFTVTVHKPITDHIFKQLTDDTNEYDDYIKHYKTTDRYEARAGTVANYIAAMDLYDSGIEQYQSKGNEAIKSKHKHKKPSNPRSKSSRNKEGSIASLYTIYLPDPTMGTSLMMDKREARKETNSFRQKYKNKTPTTVLRAKQTTNRRNKEAAIASLYTIYLPDQITDTSLMMDKRVARKEPNSFRQKHKTKTLTTAQRAKETTYNKLTSTQTSKTNKEFIKVVTLRPIVPGKATTFKHMTYEINIKKSTNERRQMKKQTKEYSSEIKHTFLKGDAAANYDDPSVQEFSQGGLRVYGTKYDRQPTTDAIVIDKALFNRLHNLERELSRVKTIVNNDTETIKELKHNIQYEDELKPKMDKERIPAKVEHYKYDSSETKSPFLEKLKTYYDENEKDLPMEHLHNRRYMASDERQEISRSKHDFYTNNFDVPYGKHVPNEMVNEQDGFNKEDIKKEDDRLLQSDSERGVLLRSARLQQKKNNEIANTFDSNENKYNNERYSRRAMINKVKEIKNKFDKARKKTEDYKIMDSLSADTYVDFDKEYIPNKDSFNRNMKDLENYLHLMIPKKN